jgi:hypothetical protein
MIVNILLLPLIAYAALGLVLSLIVHLFSFVGLPRFDEPGLGRALFLPLMLGIFPLWFVAMPLIGRITGGKNPDLKALVSLCPRWMKSMVRGLWIYAVVNFFLNGVLLAIIPRHNGPGAKVPSDPVFRFVSGYWMVFYALGLAVLVTVIRRGHPGLLRRCVNGHVAAYADRFCGVCGASLETAPSAIDRNAPFPP